jgi:hypothetical protein
MNEWLFHAIVDSHHGKWMDNYNDAIDNNHDIIW